MTHVLVVAASVRMLDGQPNAQREQVGRERNATRTRAASQLGAPPQQNLPDEDSQKLDDDEDMGAGDDDGSEPIKASRTDLITKWVLSKKIVSEATPTLRVYI